MIAQHRAVVAHFGRYPQRNEQYGRESTAEEQAWLDEKDTLPAWAKGSWNCASPEWLTKLGAMYKEGKPMPISMPKE